MQSKEGLFVFQDTGEEQSEDRVKSCCGRDQHVFRAESSGTHTPPHTGKAGGVTMDTSRSLFLTSVFVLSKKKKRKSQKVPSEMTRDHGPNSGLRPGMLIPLFYSLCVKVSQYHTGPAGIVNGYWTTGTAESNLDVLLFPKQMPAARLREFLSQRFL